MSKNDQCQRAVTIEYAPIRAVTRRHEIDLKGLQTTL